MRTSLITLSRNYCEKFCNLESISWSTAPTSSEVSARKTQRDNVNHAAAVAVLKKSHRDESPRGSLACVLPWGHGWGWVTLPNGVWSGGECNRH